MEMKLIRPNVNGYCMNKNEKSVEQLPSHELPLDLMHEFGDPEILPQVGDQYQVEIPALMTKSEYLHFTKHPTELPIPVSWVSDKVGKIKHKFVESHAGSNDNSNINGLASTDIKEHICLIDKDSKLKLEHLDMSILNPVPGIKGDSWNDMEESSFLLGLYVFGKNLVQVKRFTESKKMGDILSFYYGKFYRSEKYCRWSECRKGRSRKCGYGQRIFTGFRQQELLSRLFLHVSEECQKRMTEVSQKFRDGKMSAEEYVSNLKVAVGMNRLIEAVGIGKGKRDLTGASMEPLKPNQVIHVRQEIPIGNECSRLTSTEIIKFLTGDFRLSKARSSDLFWEAVWPRLLAGGWHSEQPKDSIKHSLVYLLPGIKKFSRRKLVKGIHYFDSVSDVLSRVASEPQLLEFEIEEDKHEKVNEFDIEDLSDRQVHCYLQPKTPNRSGVDHMKVTIVDTSLDNGEPFKVKSLAAEVIKNSTLKKISPLEKSVSESDLSSDEEDGSNSKSSAFIIDANDSTTIPPKLGKTQTSSNSLAQFTRKRRRLNACSNDNAKKAHKRKNFLVGPRLQQESSSFSVFSQIVPSHEKLSSFTSLSEKPRKPMLIDLNLPCPPSEFENDQSSLLHSMDVDSSVGQPEINSRRCSTRSRPPTRKALEALASGFFSTNKKRKGTENCTRNNSFSRRNYRSTEVINQNIDDGSELNIEGGNAVVNLSDSCIFNMFQVQAQGKGSPV